MAHFLNSQQTRPQPPPPVATVNLHNAQQNAVGVVKGIKKQNTKETLSTGAALVKGPDPVSISIWAASAGLGYAFSREHGELTIAGRQIWFKKSTTFKRFKYRHYCKMRDIQTGVTGRADDRKSKDGAVKDALQSILQNLANAGHIRLVQ